MADLDSPETTPGNTALQVAEQNVEIFKKPDKPAARRRKKVMDEETYIKEVEKIIERDFFPDLENLKEKLDYLEAKEMNDVVRLREFYAKYTTDKDFPLLHNVEDSPATFETPDAGRTTRGGSGTPGMKYSADDTEEPSTELYKGSEEDSCSKSGKKITLDEFFEKHTSEDNESFELIMKENERRFKMKYSWMFEAEEKHNKEHTPNLQPQSAQQQAEAALLSITGTSVQNDTRPKQLENWNYTTFNSVMFVPDGAQLSQAKQIELAKLKKREVSLGNTRFEGNPFTETLSQAAMLEASAVQASKKEGKVGVDDRLGHKLAEQASQKHRNRKSKAVLTGKHNWGTPLNKFGQQSSSERVTSMSPAAQRLLTTKLGVGHSTDKALRASYTPSPSVRHGTATPGAITPNIAYLTSTGRSVTPKLQIQKKAAGVAGEGELSLGLTDNLLNLPKRPKTTDTHGSDKGDKSRNCAADYF
ncbi:Splicing factor ESS-2-like [Homarus americanus]|uniref:Splicing factor ESS-2-like n=1 Tax=Homarus americanus TaxID=6706 RepID=A0A8J5JHH9_HOMAM|nr:Splicing factor ESS-2-like [Homarus americanus]